MGILDGLKDLYYGWEEKYYKFLDAIDEKIPIYKVIDPIDELVPSFALFLVLAAVILIAILGFVLSIFLIPNTSTLTVVALSGEDPLAGVSVEFEVDGTVVSTQQSNENGEAAFSGLAKGTDVVVRASKTGFADVEQTVAITDVPRQLLEISMREESTQQFTKTIRVVDGAGAAITEPLTLTFKCSHFRATNPAPVNLTSADNGTATIQVPSNCETLSVQVSDGTAFQSSSELQVNSDPFTIQLQETSRTKGRIVVNLKDSAGAFITDSVQVDLYRYGDVVENPEVGPIDFEYSSAGQAFFDRTPGTYLVKTYDSAGVFGEQSSGPITLEANDSKEVTLTLEESVKGKIKIRVLDAVSKKGIERANVTLKISTTDQTLATMQTDAEGKVEFNISRDVSYKAVAEAEGYVLKKMDGLKISESFKDIELLKCTPQTCGKLLVKVLDQDGKFVENASVVLYNASDNLLAGYSRRTTDVNGIAKFNGVSNGNYYAFAFKESISGRSDAAYFNSVLSDDDGVDLSVVMQIPLGTIRAVVTDDDGLPVPFPIVSILNGRNNEMVGSVIGNAEGIVEYETKADKYVYLKVRKKDSNPPFADYTTIAKPVVGQSVTEFRISLEPEIIDKDIKVEFLGLFRGDEEAPTVLTAGETYTAKLRLKVPEEKDYEEAGVHFRVGNDIAMEKDKLVVKNINAPKASIVKATLYDESSGFDEQQYNFTNDDGKWFNAVWDNPDAGVYEIEAEVMVKDNAAISDILGVWWRGWAQNGVRERWPVDKRQGFIELYSEALNRTYQIGVATLCTNDFCFSATIRDPDLGLVEAVTDSYTAKILQEYELRFTITNNSEGRVHDNANLRIKDSSESVKFYDYEFTDAQSVKKTGVVNDTEFPRLDTGKMESNNQITMKATFVPAKPAPGRINIMLVSDEQIVFSKDIEINISALKELQATVLPTIYPSGTEIDANITVTDKLTRLELENAVVKLLDRHDNVISTTSTGKDGVAFLTIPAQKPGEQLFVQVEKPEYKTLKITINIQKEIIEISPEQVGITLNIKDKPETGANEGIFTAKNLAFFPLKISKIKLVIDNLDKKNLLNLEKTKQWLEASYLNLVLAPGDRREMQLRAFLSDEALDLQDREQLEGRIELEVSNFGTSWSFTIPVSITIGVGGEVDDPTCLQISRKEWQASTEGQPIIAEFIIENNCTINGQPIDLQDLEAQVVWKSNSLGLYSIGLGESQTELRSGYFRTLLGRLEKEQSVPVTLTFTPYGAVNGIAEADIQIRARNALEGKDQLLTNTVATKLTVVNLTNCIAVDKDLIIIEPGSSAPFTVTTVNCGTPVDFEVNSELELSTKEFTVQDNGSQAVEIIPQQDMIPGQYPIFIKAKFSAEQKEQLLRTVRVRVLHKGCIELGKYEYDVYDSAKIDWDGVDTSTLTNNCYDKPVNVRVNMKDFQDAMKSAFKWALLTFGISMLDKGLGSVWGGSKEKTPDGYNKVQDGIQFRNRNTGNTFESEGLYEKNGQYFQIGANGAMVPVNGIQRVNAPPVAPANPNATTAGQPAPSAATQPAPTSPTGPLNTTSTGTQPSAPVELTPIEATDEAPPSIIGSPTGEFEYFGTISSAQLTGIGEMSNTTYNAYRVSGTNDYYIRTDDGLYLVTKSGQSYNFENKKLESVPPLLPSGNVVLSTSGFASLYNARYSDIPDLTGLALVGTATSGNQLLNSGGGLFGGGMGGSVFGMGGSMIDGILGQGSPFAQAGKVFLIATLVEYYRQEDEITFRTIQRDVEIPRIAGITLHPKDSGVTTLRSIVSGGIFNLIDKDVAVDRELINSLDKKEENPLAGLGAGAAALPQGFGTVPNSSLGANPEAPNLKVEKIGLAFTNKSGFTTTKLEPSYKILRIIAQRHNYKDKVYKKDDFDKVDEEDKGFLGGLFESGQTQIDPNSTPLEEENPDILQQQFHLEFNSIPPEIAATEFPGVLNCQDGVRSGSTGKQALPKILFSWSWADVKDDQCDVSNKAGTYCDATQFSIEVLKKVNTIAEFLKQNSGNLKCPSPLDTYSNVNEIGSFDIGIKEISISKANKDARVNILLQNTNPAKIDGKLVVQLSNAETGEIMADQKCEQDASVLSEQRLSCTFAGLADGSYRADAVLTPSINCQNCKDAVNSNRLGIGFTMGSTGLEQCEPFSTSRIKEILTASGIDNDSAKKVLDSVNFKAQLIEDRYTSDFQKDFHNYMTTQAFFQVDNFYLDKARGLGRLFSDKERFVFAPGIGESNPEGYKLPSAGIYNVSIDITYKDNTWNLFDQQGNPNAVVTVLLDKVDSPKPNSPFYSMPFDGPIGENGRTGYGLNYSLGNADRLEPVLINNGIPVVNTVEFTNSTPVKQLTTSIRDDFKLLNTTNRGVVLSVIGGNEPQLIFSPSYATPVILQMENKTGEAWAFYSIEVNGGAQTVGPQSLTRWNGLGLNCKGFDDKFMSEYFFAGDTHASQVECGRVGGTQANTTYGLEVCDPVKFGKMFLETTLYTPQSSDSRLRLIGASDNASFITKGAEGDLVSLNTQTLGKKLNSVQDVFEAVKDEYICISSTETRTEFWWNPKKVFTLIEQQQDNAVNQCIVD